VLIAIFHLSGPAWQALEGSMITDVRHARARRLIPRTLNFCFGVIRDRCHWSCPPVHVCFASKAELAGSKPKVEPRPLQ
jgi:hypothetical protein